MHTALPHHGAVAAWASARTALGCTRGRLNLGAAVDRIGAGAAQDRIALQVGPADGGDAISYGQLAERTDRIARVLRRIGVRKGDRVFVLLERGPEFHLAMLGALKAGAVVAPLFAAFGPEPLASRIRVAEGGALITSAWLHERKVAPLRSALPELGAVLLVSGGDAAAAASGGADTLDLEGLMAEADHGPAAVAMGEDEPAWLHFTSGTTGTPKAVVHSHAAGIGIHASAREALDLRAGDRFWCTADPGWVTGTMYGVMAPLLHGATSVIEAGDFDPRRWLDTLGRAAINVWYTTPTALRMLMRAQAQDAPPLQLPALRVVASVGEPLNAEAVEWGRRVLGHAVRDTWWQTETGAIMIACTPRHASPPGAMGQPLAGLRAHVVRRLGRGALEVLDDRAEVEGELAFEAGWPGMFRAYLGDPAHYAACFCEGLYLSGDLVRRDAKRDFWFLGRADDMIKSSGHLIGAFEVERALMAHPAVAEAAAIGLPDPTVGERVKAVVALRPEVQASPALATELRAYARARLGAVMAPKEIGFAAHLPHTRSGKIMRRLVRGRELGLPAGDLSMLEEQPDDEPQ